MSYSKTWGLNDGESQSTCDYAEFISRKQHAGLDSGFDPTFMPDWLFPFQRALIEWSVRKGRAAVFADCGLGKTAMQLVWSKNVHLKTGKPVLLLTPLAVGRQTQHEAERFGIDASQSRDGKIHSPIVITNYEQLHKFNSEDFGAVACDESSILKNFDGAIKHQVTDFMRKMPYRSLWTATAAPNDFIELGTSSEALGVMGFVDMLNMFFKKSEQTYSRSQEFAHGVYRFRGHSQHHFWRWVCNWARACRMPSDLGFDNTGYELPPLETSETVVKASKPVDGFLFDMPAIGLSEQRDERRRTIKERCEIAASLVANTGTPAVSWCHLNSEGDLLEKLIPGAVQISGKDCDDSKIEKLDAFASGQCRNIVTKPVLTGFGLNWQHCAHQTFFPSHSFEQWYQAIRRSWRFGQRNRVKIDIVCSEGERGVLSNLKRKADQASQMFNNLVSLMNNELKIKKQQSHTTQITTPSWL